MRVDFDGNAVLRAGFQYFFDVDFVSRAALKLAACHMPDDRRVRVSNCAEYSFRLLLLRHLEAAMHACDDEIELF